MSLDHSGSRAVRHQQVIVVDDSDEDILELRTGVNRGVEQGTRCMSVEVSLGLRCEALTANTSSSCMARKGTDAERMEHEGTVSVRKG
jgi:hypothetical protein